MGIEFHDYSLAMKITYFNKYFVAIYIHCFQNTLLGLLCMVLYLRFILPN